MTYDIGQKPGKGTYQCIYSSDTVTLDDTKDTLPPCPDNNCSRNHTTKWKKIS
jgi:hypothetical protein